MRLGNYLFLLVALFLASCAAPDIQHHIVISTRDQKLAERFHKNNVDYGSASLVRAALSDAGVLRSLDPAAEDFADQLDDHIKELLDEHPESYKPIDVVMADQADLVEVLHELRGIANYKGTS